MKNNLTSFNYLNSVKKQFEYYKSLGDKTFDQVPEEKLSWQFNEESNSIAMIIKHMSGNMLSRWTDVFTTDGEKNWRNRDAEFENDKMSRNSLLKMWNDGWDCLFRALNSLIVEDLARTIYIRNEAHTVQEAINRQLAHYPYHVGQLVFIGKMICNEKWNSLSIPKKQSKLYNDQKFSILKKLKGVISNDVMKAHELFWNEALSFPKQIINQSLNGKWSVVQNVDHINKVLEPFSRYMIIPKIKLEEKFGISIVESRDEKNLIKAYSDVILKDAKAPSQVVPLENIYDIDELVENGRASLKSIISSLNYWSEDELDKYLCPHPLLGRLTVREMFYFMAFHVNHHHQTIKSILLNSPV